MAIYSPLLATNAVKRQKQRDWNRLYHRVPRSERILTSIVQMSIMMVPADLNFELRYGLPPHKRDFPNINPPPGQELASKMSRDGKIISMDFYIDRSVGLHDRNALARAIRIQAWRRTN